MVLARCKSPVEELVRASVGADVYCFGRKGLKEMWRLGDWFKFHAMDGRLIGIMSTRHL